MTRSETRVALKPETVAKVIGLGYTVSVEPGAGAHAGFEGAAYTDAGADVVQAPVWDADVVLMVNAPQPDEVPQLRTGSTLIAMLAPRFEGERTAALTAAGVTALSMDAVPRISRAQSMACRPRWRTSPGTGR